jgi:hypothetical protein
MFNPNLAIKIKPLVFFSHQKKKKKKKRKTFDFVNYV